MQQLPVSDIMRECSSAVVPETTLLRDAAEILITRGHSILIVCDDDGRLCGVVPEAGVIRRLMISPSRDASIAGVMSRHVESVREDADLNSVLHLFRSSCHCMIPVVDQNGRISGSLDRQDVVRLLLSDPAEDPSAADSPRHGSQGPHFMNPERRQRQSEESAGDEAQM